MNSRKIALPVMVGLFMVVAIVLPIFPYRTEAQGQNLLANPGFEEGWYDVSIGQTPNNWRWHWLDNVTFPVGQSDNTAWAPESRVLPKGQVPEHEHDLYFRDGSYCVKIFKGKAAIYIALSQDVSGLEVGRMYRIVAPVYPDVFVWDDKKVTPPDIYTAMVRLGGGPTGATWRDENAISYSGWWDGGSVSPFYFTYTEFTHDFIATQPDMTIYIEAGSKWGLDNSGFFLDGMGLYAMEMEQTPTSTPLPPPPTPTPGPSPTPLPPPTPRPDGASVHVVQEGDTLFGIALMYGVDVDQIRELNASSLGANDIIWIDQELVISLPSEPPAPTPLPAPPTPEPTAAAGGDISGAGTGGASICVLAYHDRNSDTFRDEAAEELLPNAEFTLADPSGVVDRYTSDGISEPYCFTGLAAGAYRVIQNSPPGYEPSGPAEWSVAVAEGTSLDIQFGSSRGEGAEAPGETTEPEPASAEGSEPEEGSALSRTFATVAKVSGVLVLLMAAGVAVLFVLNRRRM